MSQDAIISPYFFEWNVNGLNYTDMLENYIFPIIQENGLDQEIFF